MLSHAFLDAWEKGAELPALRSRPVTVRLDREERVAALCPGFWYDLDLATTRIPTASALVGGLRKVRPRLLVARTYELGSPTPLANPVIVPDPSLRPAALRAIGETVIEDGTRDGADFIFVQNFADRWCPAAEVLGELGFSCVPMLPTVVVQLGYDSFDDYLGSMRAQYRRRAHQTLRRSEGLRVEHLDTFEALGGELARLWRMIFDRASELRREVLTPRYFRAMSALEGSSALVLRREDGSIAAFALLFSDHPWLSFLQCGFDERTARQHGAYFRLLYEIVRVGIEGGFRQVDLGMTALGPKLDVGGVPVPLFALLRHRNPLVHRLIVTLANGRLGPTPAEPRRVFKTPVPAAADLVAERATAPSPAFVS